MMDIQSNIETQEPAESLEDYPVSPGGNLNMKRLLTVKLAVVLARSIKAQPNSSTALLGKQEEVKSLRAEQPISDSLTIS